MRTPHAQRNNKHFMICLKKIIGNFNVSLTVVCKTSTRKSSGVSLSGVPSTSCKKKFLRKFNFKNRKYQGDSTHHY